MMHLKHVGLILAAMLLAPPVLRAQDLIRNGTFEAADIAEFCQSGTQEQATFSIFTEDLTWNKCARVDLLRYHEGEDGKKGFNAGFFAGGARGEDGQDGSHGFAVKPQTTYELSFDLKGTAQSIFVAPYAWPETPEKADNYHQEREKATCALNSAKVSPEWVHFRTTFTTGTKAARGSISFKAWCSEQYGLTEVPGTYFLIDNISVREKTATLPNGDGEAPVIAVDPKLAAPAAFVDQPPVLDGTLDDPAWSKALPLSGFHVAQGDPPAKQQTEFRLLAAPDALYLGARCIEPDIEQLKLACATDGGPLWEDDCLELFFDTHTEGITVRQFIVNAGGVRFMGWGGQPRQPSADAYAGWSAKAAVGNSEWTAVVKLPYATLGLAERPASGTAIDFNLARERRAGTTELSTWSALRGNFHEKERYGVLVFGSLADELKSRVAALSGIVEALPGNLPEAAEAKRQDLLALINRWNARLDGDIAPGDWEAAYVELQRATRESRFLKLANEVFVVTTPPTTSDFTVPFIPDSLDNAPTVIERSAAINEYRCLPVAITNLTDQIETYRVILFSRENDGIEQPGLMDGHDGLFPTNQIVKREALRTKDSDSATRGLLLDILPRMNEGNTVTVGPKESGLVWITFDTAGVAPSLYQGTLRVMPLTQPAAFNLKPTGWAYEGRAKDIPVKLTVLPIELPRDPSVQLWFMTEARNESFFADLRSHYNQVFMFSPWYFKLEFNDDGSLANPDTAYDWPKVDAVVEQHLAWMRQDGLEQHPRFMIGFSAYTVCVNESMKKKFAFNSDAWRAAWENTVRGYDAFFKKHNIGYDDYVIEVWDEPNCAEVFDQVIETLKIMKAVAPQMQTQLTMGHPIWPVEKLREVDPFVDVWAPNECYFGNGPATKFFAELSEQGRHVWYYTCNAAVREDLYRYCRLHAWKALQRNLEVGGMFKYLGGPGGHYGREAWKTAYGLFAYQNMGAPVPTIRFEVLREGYDDLKYLDKLRTALAQAQASKEQKDVDASLLAAAQSLLDKAPTDVVVTRPHQSDLAENVRAQAARLILELEPLPQ